MPFLVADFDVIYAELIQGLKLTKENRNSPSNYSGGIFLEY